MIKQAALQKYYLLRTRRQDLEKAAREVKKEEDEIYDKLFALVKKETPIEAGAFVARLDVGRRYPKWKDICEQHLGEAKVAEIIANTEPTEVLIIEEESD